MSDKNKTPARARGSTVPVDPPTQRPSQGSTSRQSLPPPSHQPQYVPAETPSDTNFYSPPSSDPQRYTNAAVNPADLKLHPLLGAFSFIARNDYSQCTRFAQRYPDIWKVPVDTNFPEVRWYASRSLLQDAARLLERQLMIVDCLLNKRNHMSSMFWLAELFTSRDTREDFEQRLKELWYQVVGTHLPAFEDSDDPAIIELGSVDIRSLLGASPDIRGGEVESAFEELFLDYRPISQSGPPLRVSYYTRKGAECPKFFRKGRVFSVFDSKPLGTQVKKKIAGLTPEGHYILQAGNGEWIHCHIQRYAVTKQGNGYVWAVPINSHNNHGTASKSINMKEHRNYAIAHSKDFKPVRQPGELPFSKNPIEVETVPGETLNDCSRIHFGKVTTIEWNVKVNDVGLIKGKFLAQFLAYFGDGLGYKEPSGAGPSTKTMSASDPKSSSERLQTTGPPPMIQGQDASFGSRGIGNPSTISSGNTALPPIKYSGQQAINFTSSSQSSQVPVAKPAGQARQGYTQSPSNLPSGPTIYNPGVAQPPMPSNINTRTATQCSAPGISSSYQQNQDNRPVAPSRAQSGGSGAPPTNFSPPTPQTRTQLSRTTTTPVEEMDKLNLSDSRKKRPEDDKLRQRKR